MSGFDLVYDNGYIEIDPSQCGYTSFLGAAVPEVEGEVGGETRPGSSAAAAAGGENKSVN